MRSDHHTNERDDQNRNNRNPQQDRFSSRDRDDSYRDDDRSLMERAGTAVRSWFNDDQDQGRGDLHNRDFRNYGQDGDETWRSQQGHNVGYSGQGYKGGMGNYAHGNQGNFGYPQSGTQYGQDQSRFGSQRSQYGQDRFGGHDMGQHGSDRFGGQSNPDRFGGSQYQGGMGSQYGQGGQSGQYGQGRNQGGMGQSGQYSQGGMGQSGQYGQGGMGQSGQYGQGGMGPQYGQYGQGMSQSGMGRYEPSSRQGMQGGQGMSQHGEGGVTRGRFVGRGPRGYKRSDERLTEEINERLTQHPDINAEEIEVKVQSGEVTLTGTVEDRQTKRMIEDLVEEISGVNELHNQLRINRGRGMSNVQSSQSSQGLSGSSQQPSRGDGQRPQGSPGMGSSSLGEQSGLGSSEKSRGGKSAS